MCDGWRVITAEVKFLPFVVDFFIFTERVSICGQLMVGWIVSGQKAALSELQRRHQGMVSWIHIDVILKL